MEVRAAGKMDLLFPGLEETTKNICQGKYGSEDHFVGGSIVDGNGISFHQVSVREDNIANKNPSVRMGRSAP